MAALLWLLAAAGYLAAEASAAVALPGYRYGTDYISTLGDPTVSPQAPLMNAAFAFQGVCFAVAAALFATAAPRTRNRLWFLVFAGANGIGNVLVAVVHSGQGNPWHVIGAVLAIAGGNGAALAGSGILTSTAYRATSITLGASGLVCLLVTAAAPSQVGAWERGSVYPIFAWQILTALVLLRRQAGSASSIS
ncbi:DUF998 domain-containing protein [Mycobacterium frederiksbergense]|nr:DUF998 domain-containing protein [Mycolicibacterium frederiksbergense]